MLEFGDEITEESVSTMYEINNLDRNENPLFPLEMKKIKEKQENDEELKRIIDSKKHNEKLGEKQINKTTVTTFNKKV